MLRKVIGLECRRLSSKRYLYIFLLLILSTTYLLIKGIEDFHETISNKDHFQQYEKLTHRKVHNYTQYSFVGVRSLLIPASSYFIFDNPDATTDLFGRTNSTGILDIFRSVKNKTVLRNEQSSSIRFSSIVFFLGTFLASYWGFSSYRSKEYLKYLTSIVGPDKVYNFIFLSRIVIIFLVFIFIIIFVSVFLLIAGFKPFQSFVLFYFSIIGFLVLIFFFQLGATIGMKQNWSHYKGLTSLLSLWILLVFVVPILFKPLNDSHAAKIESEFELKFKKLAIISDFERRVLKDAGKFNRSDIEKFKILVEKYWKEEFKKQYVLEKQFMSSIESAISRYGNLSILCPTSFFKYVNYELSSIGYENYIKFYKHMVKLNTDFSRFYIDRVFYNDPKVMVSFIQDDENLFYGQSSLPRNFYLGLGLNFVYIILLYFVGLFQYKRHTFSPSDNAAFSKSLDHKIKVNRGEVNVFYCERLGFRDYLYSVFTGKSTVNMFPGPMPGIYIGEERLSGTTGLDGFVYVCHPGAVPGDIPVKGFYRFLGHRGVGSLATGVVGKRFDQLSVAEKADVMTGTLDAVDGSVYLIDRLCKGTPLSKYLQLKDQMVKLSEKGATVIYLSHESDVPNFRKETDREIVNMPFWVKMVESRRHLVDEIEKNSGSPVGDQES